MVFLWKMRDSKGKGLGRVGGGVGTSKGTGKSMRKLCRNYPLAIYPLVSSNKCGLEFWHGFRGPCFYKENTTTVAPLLSRSVARHRGHRSKKSCGVQHFLGKEWKRVYTIGPERRVYTIEASDPEKEKQEGFHGGGVYFFLPWKRPHKSTNESPAKFTGKFVRKTPLVFLQKPFLIVWNHGLHTLRALCYNFPLFALNVTIRCKKIANRQVLSTFCASFFPSLVFPSPNFIKLSVFSSLK